MRPDEMARHMKAVLESAEVKAAAAGGGTVIVIVAPTDRTAIGCSLGTSDKSLTIEQLALCLNTLSLKLTPCVCAECRTPAGVVH